MGVAVHRQSGLLLEVMGFNSRNDAYSIAFLEQRRGDLY